MLRFILRRLVLSVFTILGVMVLTFLLFRVIAGDIAAAHVGEKAAERQKADWRHRNGYDLPTWYNLHRRLVIEDLTGGEAILRVEDGPGSEAADKLGLVLSDENVHIRLGQYVQLLSRDTPVNEMYPPSVQQRKKRPPEPGQPPPPETMVLELSDESKLTIDIAGVGRCGELVDRINDDPQNRDPATGGPRVRASISKLDLTAFCDAQFFDHLAKSVRFKGYSLVHKQRLTEIIWQRAPKSLALTVPSLAITWVLAMVISCVVAYYRGTIIDTLGVFLCVLGMCIPFLAYMIYGQWAMFEIAPLHAYGLDNRANIYVPIAIMTVAGLGGSVRFYRTVILDETTRDYVRTARAKGVPLPAVLFKHVLRNCMLPILTNLVLAIPFLIMGSLLVETYFGIPGLGDLMISSIAARDEPIMSGMVFLTAVIYTLGVLATDLCYALFDPRVRLR